METKLILKAPIARHLVNRGHRIVDIKPNKENRDKTVFIFQVLDEKKFNDDFNMGVEILHKDNKKSEPVEEKVNVDVEAVSKVLAELIKSFGGFINVK
jgi:hypothetical protein